MPEFEFAAQRGQCSSCGAPIIWAMSERRKRMPMDAEPTVLAPGQYKLRENDDGSVDAYLVRRVWVSHFATCPNADQHRRN